MLVVLVEHLSCSCDLRLLVYVCWSLCADGCWLLRVVGVGYRCSSALFCMLIVVGVVRCLMWFVGCCKVSFVVVVVVCCCYSLLFVVVVVDCFGVCRMMLCVVYGCF